MSNDNKQYTISSVLEALDIITRGRVVKNWNEVISGENPYVCMKTSHIPGKSVMEIPGLIFGRPEHAVSKVGVVMTLTEQVIELASGMGIDLIIAHHPVADAANSGGVPFAHYLPLYHIAVIELHEAFHGLHPGVAFIHGHRKLHTDTSFGGIIGNVLHVGVALDEVRTAGDMIRRLEKFIGLGLERDLLSYEREVKHSEHIYEATLVNPAKLLSGDPDNPVKHILHFFPHTGFNLEHLQLALDMYPETDTIIASISRVKEDHPLVQEARKRGLTFIVGNSHSVEILENGVPLALAVEKLCPGLEVHLIRERVTAELVSQLTQKEIVQYGRSMVDQYLVPDRPQKSVGRRHRQKVTN